MGRGAPVVLLHAGVADRRMWSEHLAPLADAGYRVIAPDLPGFGDAPPRPEQAPWAALRETLHELGIDQAALVGNSFGGAVAMRLAALHPYTTRALVLVAAPAPDLTPSPELQAAWDAEDQALREGDVEGALQAVVAAWLPADAPEPLRRRIREMQLRAFELGGDGEETEHPDPLEDDPGIARAITAPTLIVAAERDMIDFRHGAERLAELLPHAESVTLPEVGHLVPMEAPERFNALLLDFLARS